MSKEISERHEKIKQLPEQLRKSENLRKQQATEIHNQRNQIIRIAGLLPGNRV